MQRKPGRAQPVPRVRNRARRLIDLLFVLARNPLDAWTPEYFEKFFVRSGLPFLSATVASNPDAVRHVLLDNAGNYRKDNLLQRILSPGLSNGLLTVEAGQWRRQRRAVAPQFSPKVISGFAPAMAAAADALAARWSSLPDDAVVDVAADMTCVTLDVLSRTIFSDGIGADAETFREAMRRYFDAIGKIDPFDVLGLPRFVPRLTRLRARKPLRFFDGAIDAITERRRQSVAMGKAAPRDILTLLLEARDPHSGVALDEAEVRANILTLIVAGHETTANTLSWSLHLLGTSEKWRTLAFDEARQSSWDGVEDLSRHNGIVRAVIDEALRLYPPITAISRVALADDEIAGEPIKAGTMVIMAPYLLHRHRLLWSEPDAFRPERFLRASGEPVHRYAYIPFGAGARTCLGAAFALQEATIVLSRILRSFELLSLPNRCTEPLLRITLRPRGGLPMILRHRAP